MMQKMLSMVRRAVDHYSMIAQGDRIAVGVSGGKDSLTLLTALAKLRQFYPLQFEVVAITLEMGYDDMDFSHVQTLCDELGVEYIRVPTQIKQIVFDIRHEENPCSLCAKMRRGALHEAALTAGCRKIALGHHFDDAVETYMLSLFYEGRISCFKPVTYLDRRSVTLIRPLLYVTEQQIRGFTARQALPVVFNPCPADGKTKRQEVKDLLRTLETAMPGVRERIFGAMQRYPLDGWEPDKRERRAKARQAENVAHIEIQPAYNAIDSVKALFTEYAHSLPIDLAYQGYDAEYAGLPGDYVQPDGRLYLALVDGEVAGCVALRRFDADRCEMKRLYVRPQFRGLALGQLLSERVIADARVAGYAAMLLDTLPEMKNALRLYHTLGFAQIPPYYVSPIQTTCYLCLTLCAPTCTNEE